MREDDCCKGHRCTALEVAEVSTCMIVYGIDTSALMVVRRNWGVYFVVISVNIQKYDRRNAETKPFLETVLKY